MAYLTHLLILSGIYSILALSLNLITGFVGLVAVSHAAFFGIGAYTTALFVTKFGFNFFAALVIGIFFSGLIAAVAGRIFSKFRGDYYTLATLGLNIIIYSVMLNWQKLTNGPLGISAVPHPDFFGISFYSSTNFLFLTLMFVAATFLIAHFLVKSSFGRILKAIRDDEGAIQVFGYKAFNYKLTIFVVGSGLAAVAGSLYASYLTYIDPTVFAVDESIFILAIIILGGLASLRGSIVGAVFLVFLPELLRFIGLPSEIAAQTRLMLYGAILIFLMLYRPQGLMGEYKL